MRILLTTLLISALLGAAGLAQADSAAKDKLKDRFVERHPQIRQLKDEGKVGETHQGLLEAVEARFAREANVRELVRAENADRESLYALIAAEQQTSRDTVAAHAARSNFKYARKGDWLKYENGWKRKE